MGGGSATPGEGRAGVTVAGRMRDAGWADHLPEAPAVTTSGTVAVLCPRAWGVRNVVHSGMLGQLSAWGIDVRLVTSLADAALAGDEWGSAARCVELLPATVTGSQRGLAFWNGILHASFSRRQNSPPRRRPRQLQSAESGMEPEQTRWRGHDRP